MVAFSLVATNSLGICRLVGAAIISGDDTPYRAELSRRGYGLGTRLARLFTPNGCKLLVL